MEGEEGLADICVLLEAQVVTNDCVAQFPKSKGDTVKGPQQRASL